MKKLLLILFFIPALLFTQQIDTNIFRYYPLKVGNTWTYRSFNIFMGSTRYKISATNNVILSGRHYFELTRYQTGYAPTISYLRIDSLKGSVRTYSTNAGCNWTPFEKTGDSLAARKTDSSKYDCAYYYRCIDDTSHRSFFGLNRSTKEFSWTDYFEHVTYRLYMQDIGMLEEHQLGPAGSGITIDLLGCVINGIVRGDTSLVGITQLTSEIPKEYSLHQNYPNPFNPVTNIKFDLPESGFVELDIYDINGREITKLVNQQLSAGSYSADWDASNYSSGVYICKLTTGKFSSSMKMIVLK